MMSFSWTLAFGRLILYLASFKEIVTAVVSVTTPANLVFFLLFFFRYLRYIVHNITGILLYRPSFSKANPRFRNQQVAVIVPTVGPNTAAFLECCKSILSNRPRVLIISTVGAKLEQDTRRTIQTHDFLARFPETRFLVVQINEVNKRRQIVEASKHINAKETPISVCVDDHVYWLPTFFHALLPAFDNTKVGLVGTSKKVIRDRGDSLYKSFTNFIACIYLERDNFRIRSEPYIDSGVFCVSGRTSAILTAILQNKDFRQGYSNETFFFGWLGPLNPDDDNYVVRYVLRNGWKVVFQCMPDCTIRTPLGDPQKFWKQVLR